MLTTWPIVISFIVGIVFVIVIELLLLFFYIRGSPKQQIQSLKPNKPEISKDIEDILKEKSKNIHLTSQVLNIVFQMLFQELRHTERVRKWFIHRLNNELQELLLQRTTGRLFEQVVLSEFDMGRSVPMIKSISIEEVLIDDSCSVINKLVLLLPIEYDGKFQMAVDSKLVLGQTAYVSILIRKVVGTLRLQLERHPFTHWSVCFTEDPYLDLEVKSLIHGRELPKITSLIVHQIRKSVRKKHTFPSYKVRFKPFFPPDEETWVDPSEYPLPEGTLVLEILQLGRLPLPYKQSLYLCAALDCVSWQDFHDRDLAAYETLEVKINAGKLIMVTIAVQRKFVYEKLKFCTVVDHVKGPNCYIHPGDIIAQINGISVKSPEDVLFTGDSNVVNIKLERKVKDLRCPPTPEIERKKSSGQLRGHKGNTASVKNSGLNLKVTTTSPGTSSSSPSTPTGLGSLIKRKVKGQSKADLPKDDLSTRSSKKTLNETFESSSDTTAKGFQLSPMNITFLDANFEDSPQCRMSKIYYAADSVDIMETFTMNISNESLYLNICVKSVGANEDNIVSLLSVPLISLIVKCSLLSRGPFLKTFYLKPSRNTAKSRKFPDLSSHPGFNPSMCFGDILLSCAYGKTSASVTEDNISETNTEDNSRDFESKLTGDQPQKHDFIRAQFERGTLCEFCHKKIWLKEAFSCNNCNIPCHKKCILKCLLLTSCSSLTTENKDKSLKELNYPEIITTQFSETGKEDVKVENEDLDQETIHQWRQSLQLSSLRQRLYFKFRSNSVTESGMSLNSFLSNITGENLRRAGSVSSLAPPTGSGFAGISKSLPPSPQHSPQPSRKGSLVGNPFAPESEVQDYDDEIQAAVERLVQYSEEEELISLAKETGKYLYNELPLQERKSKLNSLITRLQVQMDNNTILNKQLQLQLAGNINEAEKVQLTGTLTKTEAHIQALAVLMLYYFSGLQQVLDLESQNDCSLNVQGK